MKNKVLTSYSYNSSKEPDKMDLNGLYKYRSR